METKRQAKKHNRRESAGLSADSVGLRTLDKGTQPEDEDSNVITRRTLFADVRKHGLGSLFRKSTIVVRAHDALPRFTVTLRTINPPCRLAHCV